jgi:hypothetical protein
MRAGWSVVGLLACAACGGSGGVHPTAGTAGASGQAAGHQGDAAGVGATDPSGAAGSGGAAGTTGVAGSPSQGGSSGASGDVGGSGGTPVAVDDGGAPTEPPPDGSVGDADAGVGVPLPPYDGGIVSVINGGNWNETTIHPFSTRRMLVRDECDPHVVLLDFARADPVVWKQVADGPWARSLQLIGNNQVLGGRNDGYEVFDLTTGQIVKQVKTYPNTQSAYRMANGETMLTRSGTELDFLDKSDDVAHSLSYPGFGYVRIARPTRNGTFLIPSDTKLVEGDAKGNVLWTAAGPEWAHAWEPLLMSDGNVLLATGFGSSLDVVDRTTHLVVKRYGTKAMPMAATFRPNFFAEFQILPNGNLITSNWTGGHGCGGNSGVQVIEFNPAGDVVWFYKQDPLVLSSVQGVMVIDGMDPRFLHVQEISADSTWQPVIPTP